jgi:DNA replication protein DnaC
VSKAGVLVRCEKCFDARPSCGLEEHELSLTVEDIKGDEEIHDVLRYLVQYCISHPVGWLTLYGRYGTAKSLTAQIIVAGLARKGKPVRYIHAKKLEQMWFDDMHNDTSNGLMLEEIPALVVDEVDKMNMNSSWVRSGLQAMADARYRSALARKTFTVWVVQADPEKVLPGDIASRMNDGRFRRPW